MGINLPKIKGSFAHSIPKFSCGVIPESQRIDRSDIFALYAIRLGNKLPIVLYIHSDRIHVYNDKNELVYNLFNNDIYSTIIAPNEEVMRLYNQGLVLYGWLYPDDLQIDIFHIYSWKDKKWFDYKQMIRRSNTINLPQISFLTMLRTDTIRNIINIEYPCLMKSVNDPSQFFVNQLLEGVLPYELEKT